MRKKTPRWEEISWLYSMRMPNLLWPIGWVGNSWGIKVEGKVGSPHYGMCSMLFRGAGGDASVAPGCVEVWAWPWGETGLHYGSPFSSHIPHFLFAVRQREQIDSSVFLGWSVNSINGIGSWWEDNCHTPTHLELYIVTAHSCEPTPGVFTGPTKRRHVQVAASSKEAQLFTDGLPNLSLFHRCCNMQAEICEMWRTFPAMNECSKACLCRLSVTCYHPSALPWFCIELMCLCTTL